ncbi:hypothetical protein C2845_PM18G03180 [Panicum miliaceum]|uniref:ACT domain-containing protein n=1 Tax=Panicum miliaceum TaxID=4540 RepID=A0A3L6PI45_PANMI|nr:hypothetical protein C2845_PM18G03180 [Panicum miliaceum]
MATAVVPQLRARRHWGWVPRPPPAAGAEAGPCGGAEGALRGRRRRRPVSGDRRGDAGATPLQPLIHEMYIIDHGGTFLRAEIISSLMICADAFQRVIKRHTLSVFVGDESGMINRIAGVFARRGYNIESLAVGLNKDKALFTIVVSGTDKILNQVVEQLNKLVNVIKVVDLSKEPQVERELMLIKINAERDKLPEIMGLVRIFKAEVVDLSDNTLTIEIALRREKMGETAPFWRFSAASYPDLEVTIPSTSRPSTGVDAINQISNESSGGDVYPVESYESFSANQILDAHWGVMTNGDVQDFTHLPFAARELMIIKLTGDIDKMVRLHKMLEQYGICEVARTGRVALLRESGVDSKYLRGFSLPL